VQIQPVAQISPIPSLLEVLMRTRDALGLALAPLFLRFMLAITFLWAGASKFLAESPVPPAVIAATPAAPVDSDGSTPEPTDLDANTPVVDAQPIAQADATPDSPPTPGTQKRYHNLSRLIVASAHPGFDANGDELKPIWPKQLATGHWPNTLALAAGISELLGGLLLLVGLFTRFGAIMTFSVMAVAIWLTQIGPAMQAGGALFGFLPPYGAFDLDASGKPVWMPLLWLAALGASSAAVVFLGGGTLSLDRVIFGSGARSSTAPEGKE
jgi:uncharacterized membrane protein YphA (DoxX/SURF4 family)